MQLRSRRPFPGAISYSTTSLLLYGMQNASHRYPSDLHDSEWQLLQPLLIVRRLAGGSGFHSLPKRGMVERTLGWLVKSRRLACDYETAPQSSEAMIYLPLIRLMLKRLAIATP